MTNTEQLELLEERFADKGFARRVAAVIAKQKRMGLKPVVPTTIPVHEIESLKEDFCNESSPQRKVIINDAYTISEIFRENLGAYAEEIYKIWFGPHYVTLNFGKVVEQMFCDMTAEEQLAIAWEEIRSDEFRVKSDGTLVYAA